MMTREEVSRALPPLASDGVEGWLRRYAIDYARLILARDFGDEADIAAHEARCAVWVARLTARLSPARFAFELDEARRQGEQEVNDWREVFHRQGWY